jgi:Cys-rich protein (TIGR01571 family)
MCLWWIVLGLDRTVKVSVCVVLDVVVVASSIDKTEQLLWPCGCVVDSSIYKRLCGCGFARGIPLSVLGIVGAILFVLYNFITHYCYTSHYSKDRLLQEDIAATVQGIPVDGLQTDGSFILRGIPMASQPQPVQHFPCQPQEQQWSADLCDCCSNPACCYATFCGPCFWGENMEKLDGSGCIPYCALISVAQAIHPCFSAAIGGHKRSTIRRLFGIPTSCLPDECGAVEDVCCHLPLLQCCATIQENHLLNAAGATRANPATAAVYPVHQVVMAQPVNVVMVPQK